MFLPFYYYILFPWLKINNIRRTKIKRAMNCPQCKDFLDNSERYAFSRLSPEIAVEADSYAIKMTEDATNTEARPIDLYMMYYRIEYTRLQTLKKEKYVDIYLQTISSKYSGNPNLCANCKIPDSYDFNNEVSFCFHLESEDDSCSNCQRSKNNNIKTK